MARLAALDVGTNTVLMLVVELHPNGTLHKLADLSRIARLGRGVDRTGRLDPDSAAMTLATIAEFATRARELGVDRIIAVATAALRDAADGASFIQQVRDATGVELRIISGEAEARLSYLAVAKGLDLQTQSRILLIDIGGGSTEFIRSEPDRDLQAVSLQIGSVRLTERFFHNDPPSAEEVAALRAAVDKAIDSLNWKFRPEVLVGIAGTATTICAVALRLADYDSNLVHGHRLTRTEVGRTLNLFATLPYAERRKLPGLAEGRVDVILAGAVILDRVMERFGLAEVVISDQGVRWGLIWQELEGHGG
ncbi:MAG: Ppx/GppA family phosphatase [Candidatus Binataceae bacterium]|nr:Ppx/GppA family phosphatase [Candidatus Binataceae bacterium]